MRKIKWYLDTEIEYYIMYTCILTVYIGTKPFKIVFKAAVITKLLEP